MAEKNRYGKQLTEEEYSGRLAGLIREFGQAASGVADQEEFTANEFNLLIDFKLGIDFPKDKRDALGEARKRIREHHLLLVRRFQAGEISAEELGVEIEQKIPAMMAEEFSKILAAEDLENLLGIVNGQAPEIPVDASRISGETLSSDSETDTENNGAID